MTCATGCMTDPDCPTGDFCQSDGTCAVKLPKGAACTLGKQCQSGDCIDQVCSLVVGSGGGVSCATRPVGSSGPSGSAGLFGLLLAFVVARRRGRGGRSAAS
jgi:MYXO-CTERM domain-containing protein